MTVEIGDWIAFQRCGSRTGAVVFDAVDYIRTTPMRTTVIITKWHGEVSEDEILERRRPAGKGTEIA